MPSHPVQIPSRAITTPLQGWPLQVHPLLEEAVVAEPPTLLRDPTVAALEQPVAMMHTSYAANSTRVLPASGRQATSRRQMLGIASASVPNRPESTETGHCFATICCTLQLGMQYVQDSSPPSILQPDRITCRTLLGKRE